MTKRYYLLISGIVVPSINKKTWAMWYRMAKPSTRIVMKTAVKKSKVVTSFIGDENCMYQSVVLRPENDDFVDCYRTIEQAEQGHHNLVNLLNKIV